jgi:16S rRNA (cytidine1402-2'-O)-methyltransferase
MSVVYLIPTFLAENAKDSIPAYVLDTVKKCNVIFAENERTARRYLKCLDSSISIDAFEWHTIHKTENELKLPFSTAVKSGKNIAIISEAGCPGIADPGQTLVQWAQEMNVTVKPLVGPSSIFLALMASGMNGQHFEFVGYLPIDNSERVKKIKEMETQSSKLNCTKIFIETPYRNNQLFEALLQHCQNNTKICIGKNITSDDEIVQTKSVGEWKKNKPELHKSPVIFLLQG